METRWRPTILILRVSFRVWVADSVDHALTLVEQAKNLIPGRLAHGGEGGQGECSISRAVLPFVCSCISAAV